MIQKYKIVENLELIIENLELIIENMLNNWNFKVHNAFNLSNYPNWRIQNRKIEDWMIVYARGGEGYYEIDGTRFPIEEGKVYFLSHDVYHSASQCENSPVSVIAIRFGIYNSFTNKHVYDEISPFAFCCKINRTSYYLQLFESIYYNFKQFPEKLGQSICNTLLCQIFNSLYFKLAEDDNNVNSDRRIQKAKLYIEENIMDNNLSLEKVAEYIKLSPKYFSKLFTKQYQISFKKYVFNAKMNYAKYLLEETNHNVKTVAEQLGYSDQYIFSNLFKYAIGVAPSRVLRGRNKTNL